jgi:hypothetical protein
LRAAALAVAFGLAVAVVLAQPAGAAAGAPATVAGGRLPEPAASTRYYVVRPPVDGQREYLYGIAVRVLGDGNRYREIYALNRGRPQPDGGRLTDPLDLRPGWVLVLPADAAGPDVRIGSPPGQPPTEPAHAPPPGGPSKTGFVGYLLSIGALALVAILFGAVLRVLRRDRSAGAPEPLPAPTRPALPHTPEPHTPEPHAPEPHTPEPHTPEPHAPEPRTPEPGGLVPPAGGLDGLRATVRNGDDRLAVRLTGVEATPLAHAWLTSSDSPPGAGLRLVLGHSERGALCVDLAHTPDVFTITGPLEACRRLALALAGQARGAGMDVMVVGDAIGREDAPPGCRWAASFPEPEEMLDPGRVGGSSLVISLGLRGAELRSARRLMARTDRLAVPILIGEVLRARWSVEVTPNDVAPPAPKLSG